MQRIAMAAALLVLGGCASKGLSEAECRTADWRAIGFEDGARGASPERFGAHRRACAEHGVTPGFEAYLAGHAEGLERFCRPQNGAHLGESGVRYKGGCPSHLEGAFLGAWEEGYGLYERRAAVNRVRRQLQAKHARSNAIEHEIVSKTASLVGPGLTPAQRAGVVVELKQLAEEKVLVASAMRRLEVELAEAEHELQTYRGVLANQSVD